MTPMEWITVITLGTMGLFSTIALIIGACVASKRADEQEYAEAQERIRIERLRPIRAGGRFPHHSFDEVIDEKLAEVRFISVGRG